MADEKVEEAKKINYMEGCENGWVLGFKKGLETYWAPHLSGGKRAEAIKEINGIVAREAIAKKCDIKFIEAVTGINLEALRPPEQKSTILNMMIVEFYGDELSSCYRKGALDGEEKGFKDGREEVVRNALFKNLPPEQIQRITGLEMDVIQNIQSQL